MKNIKRIMMVACLLWMPVTFGFGADLIEPTRILEGENLKPGRLYVFSEPPGLMVTLDGNTIGKAPIYLDSVGQGAHQLQVAGKETTILITAGEILRLSFFKGRFIEIPPEETGAPKQPQTVEKPRQKPGSEQKAQKSEQLEPGYFPLKPSGPIY